MDYGQTKITVLVSTGSDGYFQMNMRKEGFGNLVGYGTPLLHHILYIQ